MKNRCMIPANDPTLCIRPRMWFPIIPLYPWATFIRHQSPNQTQDYKKKKKYRRRRKSNPKELHKLTKRKDPTKMLTKKRKKETSHNKQKKVRLSNSP